MGIFDEIDSSIAEDIKSAIDKKQVSESLEPPRGHLGASVIGKACEREIWYSFHWAKFPKFSARMYRLFNRGHLEEKRFEKWLIGISDKFWAHDPKTGDQIRISNINGYFGGSLDGVVRNPAGWKGDYLTEFKTHSLKSYEKLVKNGVKEAKPEHYTQMQIYLYHKPQLKGALYFAICKNDDDLYIEYVERDEEHAKEKLKAAVRVIESLEPRPRMKSGSEFNFYCKYFCDFEEVCFKNKAPEISCRSCAYVDKREEGWYCRKHDNFLTVKEQLEGCEKYERLY